MTKEEGYKLFEELNISRGEEFLVDIPELPTPMMMEFGRVSDFWKQSLMKLQGKMIEIRDFYIRDGLPFVETRSCGHIVPLDCLDVYHNRNGFEPDEGVDFFE